MSVDGCAAAGADRNEISVREDDMDPGLGNRRRLRYSVQDMTLSINGKSYRIFNINEFGVGFLIDSPDEIEIGTEIQPMLASADRSVQVAGVPRHVSQFKNADDRLHFRSGWVCGTEFTTQQDLAGGQMLRDFIAETIAAAKDENLP
jgi:hypothetical protein